jgi:hypothetical protein
VTGAQGIDQDEHDALRLASCAIADVLGRATPGNRQGEDDEGGGGERAAS